MTRDKEPIEHIRCAHRLLVKAGRFWNAGSSTAVRECMAVLEESICELRAAGAGASGHPDSLRDGRDEILEMKKKVARLEQLSDLAAALLRGGAASTGNSPLYRSGGFAVPPDSSSISTAGVHA
jgi:hypothetical protein